MAFTQESSSKIYNEKKYIKKLHECGSIAEKQANNIMNQKLPKIRNLLNQSKNNLEEFVGMSSSQKDFNDPQLEELLLNLTESIESQLNVGLRHMEDSLNKKQKHLRYFTVTLFGRTKAGKSTIREALTLGDGLSIGKGLQRTTREIKEYEWNLLRIIDTPGIAAYEGDEDTAIAESVIDESDVILFLLTTDGIQESEFEQLSKLKSLNKPIVILLNVKQDLTNNIRRKRFLSNWINIVSEEGQIGHIERIRKYTKEYFGLNEVKIIPFHAQAAFLSTQENDEILQELLYEASQLEKIKETLQDIVVNEGTQHRLKTFHDTHIYYLNSLSSVYWDSYRNIKPRVFYMKTKINKFKQWLNKFDKQGLDMIDSRVEQIFAPIYSEIGNFVDEYAGRKDAENQWKKIMDSQAIHSKIETICNDLEQELKIYIMEFSRQLNFEIQSINFETMSYGVNDVAKGVMGKVARWGGAALGVAEGALVFGAIMNFWNPAGWVMGALGIAAITVSIFGWIFGDDTKRHEKEKDKVKHKMTSELKKQEYKIQKELKKWLKTDILAPIKRNLSTQVFVSLKTMEKLLDELEKESKTIDKEIMAENKELIRELYLESFGIDIKYSLSSIAREQGTLTKILYKDKKSIFINKNRKELEKILGERVITVSFDQDPIELFKRAMFPVSLSTEQIVYIYEENKFIVKSPKKEIGKIIGKKGRHIKSTSKLLDCSIEILEV